MLLGWFTGVGFIGCAEPDFRSSDAAWADAQRVERDEGAGGTGGEGRDASAGRQDAAGGGRGDAASTDAQGGGEDEGVAGDGGARDLGGTPVVDARPPPPDAARPSGPALLGDWLSEGDDVAPIIADPPASIRRIEANFSADGRFVVRLTNRDAQRFELSGTYRVDERTRPASIALEQIRPERVRSEGIWEVLGDTLTYEVAQIDPPIGDVTPPTPGGGFGSTSSGRFGTDNVQTYRRR